MSAHTPGPWEAVTGAEKRALRNGWREIRTVGRMPVVTAGSVDVHNDDDAWTECGVVISEADARLIAAAPDLLACALAADEALSNACDPVKDSNNPLEALRWNLRESIKKATHP